VTWQTLESIQEAPQLPANYMTMVLLALLPGAWFHFMDPLALQQGDKVTRT
jgi:hypothetical protein